jgi:hypothetical protein
MISKKEVVEMFVVFNIYFIFSMMVRKMAGKMIGKLFVDHKLELYYCIHGDASRIAGILY